MPVNFWPLSTFTTRKRGDRGDRANSTFSFFLSPISALSGSLVVAVPSFLLFFASLGLLTSVLSCCGVSVLPKLIVCVQSFFCIVLSRLLKLLPSSRALHRRR